MPCVTWDDNPSVAAGVEEAAVADAQPESHHLQEQSQRPQKDQRQQAMEDTNPTEGNGITTGTIATSVGIMRPSGTLPKVSPTIIGRVGVRKDAHAIGWMDIWQQDVVPAKRQSTRTSYQLIRRQIRCDRWG